MLRRRWFWVIAIATVVALVGGGEWLYQHPPLTWDGTSFSPTLDGIGLTNMGRWPATVSSVEIDGSRQPDSIRMIRSFTAHLAFNVPMAPRDGDRYTYGAIAGWRVERWISGRFQPSDALVVDWGAVTPPPQYQVRIHYRYLGLPMTLTLDQKR